MRLLQDQLIISMKLYATTTSERASKGQGGQKYIQVNLTTEKKHWISLTMKVNEKRNVYELWVTHENELPKLIKERSITKGEKKKGETICARRDCTIKEHKHSWMK